MNRSSSAQASARRKLLLLAIGKRPRRRRRPMPKQAQPNAIRLAYFVALRGVIGGARKLVQDRLVPMLPHLVEAAGTVHDAVGPLSYPAAVDELLDQISEKFFDEWPNEKLRALAQTIAKRTANFQREQLGKQMQEAIGIDVFTLEPEMKDRLEAFADGNVALIKTVPERYFGELKTQVVTGLRQGKRAEDLAKDIAARYGVSESRAELIARDQIGKLNGELNQARQQALGIEGYVWRTAEDERVRPEHEDRDGEQFDWNDPPEDGHPGFPINCRCVAEPNLAPILDELP